MVLFSDQYHLLVFLDLKIMIRIDQIQNDGRMNKFLPVFFFESFFLKNICLLTVFLFFSTRTFSSCFFLSSKNFPMKIRLILMMKKNIQNDIIKTFETFSRYIKSLPIHQMLKQRMR